MELQYELTMDDLMAFHRRHLRRLWRTAGYVAALLGLVVSSLVFLVMRSERSATSSDHLPLFVWPIMTGVVTAVVAGTTALLGLVHARFVRAGLASTAPRDAFGKHTVVLCADEVIERTGTTETRRRWEAVENIEEGGDFIAFCDCKVTSHNYWGAAMKPLIIPKRAFQDEHHMQVFLDEARRLKAEAAAAAAQAAEAQRPPAW